MGKASACSSRQEWLVQPYSEATYQQLGSQRSAWKNPRPLRLGKFALPFVERIKDVGPQNKCGCNMEKVERSGAKSRAVLTRKNQSLFPDLRTKRRNEKYTGGLMLQKQIVNGPSLEARPFLSEHSQLDGVGEFRLAQRGQQKYGFGPNQASGDG
jgi:hypothetical protein